MAVLRTRRMLTYSPGPPTTVYSNRLKATKAPKRTADTDADITPCPYHLMTDLKRHNSPQASEEYADRTITC